MNRKKIFQPFDYYVLLFFSLAFIGWLWEVALFFFTDHAFINRGVYRGPYLPIYGVGGLLLCLCFRTLRKRPFLVFGLSLILCSIVEYLTSYFLELRWGIRWWDYSRHFMNINGNDKVYQRLSGKWRAVLCLLLLVVFVADATYCAVQPNVGKGISWDGK